MKKSIVFILLMTVCLLGISPAVLAQDKSADETIVFTLTPPPSCNNCVEKIKSNLRFEKGVKEINVSLKTKTVAITYSPDNATPESLTKALKKIGYEATPYDPEAPVAKATPCSGCSGDHNKCK